VGTLGLILKAKVPPANAMDRDETKPSFERVRQLFPRLSPVCLTQATTGKGKDWAEKLWA
jgi:hypothetical protein